MTEDQLRSLIRDVVARHLEHAAPGSGAAEPIWKSHASHLRLPVSTGQDADGPCLIEPTVRCNHCGYCQSLGH